MTPLRRAGRRRYPASVSVSDVVEAGRRFVEQQHRRLRGDRPRQLEQPSLAVGEPARRRLGEVAEPDPGERVDRDVASGHARGGARAGAGTTTAGMPVSWRSDGREEHVLDADEVVVGLRRLVRAQQRRRDRLRPGVPSGTGSPVDLESTRAGTTPVSAFTNVVLPLPFGPTSPRICLRACRGSRRRRRRRRRSSPRCRRPAGWPGLGDGRAAPAAARARASRVGRGSGTSPSSAVTGSSTSGGFVMPKRSRQPRPLRAVDRAMLQPRLDPSADPDEALGHEDHRQQQHRAVDDLVVLADLVAEQLDVEALRGSAAARRRTRRRAPGPTASRCRRR